MQMFAGGQIVAWQPPPFRTFTVTGKPFGAQQEKSVNILCVDNRGLEAEVRKAFSVPTDVSLQIFILFQSQRTLVVVDLLFTEQLADISALSLEYSRSAQAYEGASASAAPVPIRYHKRREKKRVEPSAGEDEGGGEVGGGGEGEGKGDGEGAIEDRRTPKEEEMLTLNQLALLRAAAKPRMKRYKGDGAMN